MTPALAPALCALLLAAPSLAEAAVFPRSAPPGQCRTVHGRLALYNGTLSFRIWVVGTHRMLRVVDADGDNVGEIGKLPPRLARSLELHRDELFRTRAFADFRVCAFTRSRPGVMQSVTLEEARNVRIETD
jgi:hypothetical protein